MTGIFTAIGYQRTGGPFSPRHSCAAPSSRDDRRIDRRPRVVLQLASHQKLQHHTNVLFGHLLAISPDELTIFMALLIALGLSIGLTYRQLLYSSINAPVAEAKGLPVRALSVLFMVLLALAVTMAVQAVGTLLLFALLITPAATAINLTPRPVAAMAISTGLSVVCVWIGLAASAMFNLPPSFLIVTFACAIWLAVYLRASRIQTLADRDHETDTELPATTQTSSPTPAR